MGYFQVRYDSRVVIYDCRAFIRLTTGRSIDSNGHAFITTPSYTPVPLETLPIGSF